MDEILGYEKQKRLLEDFTEWVIMQAEKLGVPAKVVDDNMAAWFRSREDEDGEEKET